MAQEEFSVGVLKKATTLAFREGLIHLPPIVALKGFVDAVLIRYR